MGSDPTPKRDGYFTKISKFNSDKVGGLVVLRLILVMMLGIWGFGCTQRTDESVGTVEDDLVGPVEDFSSGAVIVSIEPRSGRLDSGKAAARVTIVFNKPPIGLWVTGAQEWSLQQETLSLLTEYCEHRDDSLKVKIGWASGGKMLNYSCP